MHSVFLPQVRPGRAVRAVSVQPAKPRIEPIPRDQWPMWADWVALAQQAGDKGLGDTVIHIIGETNSERFKTWFQEKFGKSCGCKERQRWLNRRYPYV